MLAWWEHLRPADGRLHVIALTQDGEPRGLAPFFVQPGRPVANAIQAAT